MYRCATRHHLYKSKLTRAINRNVKIKLSFDGLHFCNIDMKIANRIRFELLTKRLITSNIRQAVNVMPLQTAM